ncbi:MAG TPA: multidrug effflux MFS transporter [Methylomusa anaerophila]|uniref:Bcr/CflA family efflux transporter n=1 Tax=Methylomusa anaerophila TaxID=1930071 RepID=A0A348AJ52_9FIRM|nr:multidrug effflux MFS transporter [Methylomusa anaerophila]BBB91100.1 bicyclomycin resistance protein [Methylomusa anaerophila]HML88977.1 multidrug effflux MFS transporter [Methylomusa anaerophila]
MINFTQESTAVSKKNSHSDVLWMAFLLGLLAAFAPLTIDMYLPALPKLGADLNAGASLAQFSLTACLLGIALGQLVAGPISDVRGRKGPLLAGLLIYVVASLSCAFAPTIWLLVVMRFIQGLAGSAGIVISRAIVRDLYSGFQMTRFFALLMLVNGVAPILAPVLGGQVLQVTSWRGIFLVLSVVGIFTLLAVSFGLPETLRAGQRSKGGINNTFRAFRRLIGNRIFMGYALVQGFALAAMFAYIAGSPFVLQNIFGVSPQIFSLLFGINSLGIIIAGQITGRLAGRIPEAQLLVAGLTIAFVGGVLLLAMILAGGGLYSILVPLFFAVSSVGIIGTSSFSLAMQDQAKDAGSASALIGVLSFVFGGLMAPLVGIGGSHTAVPMGIIIAFSETMAALCYLFLVKCK